MEHFNDLPKRHPNHSIESKAEAAFNNLLVKSKSFILQSADRKDYGTDCQIEVVDQEYATNIRLHVQLKGTEKAFNKDGSISIEIQRSNLNYLLIQPHSLFICYHVPTNTLWFCPANVIPKQYEHKGQTWSQQKTITVIFSKPLTSAYLESLSNLAKASAQSSRDSRITQITANPKSITEIIKAALPDLYVPEDKDQAASLLSSLYDRDMNELICNSFEKFIAVLGQQHNGMMFCYMAEINLGMAGKNINPERIKAGITYLKSKLDAGRHYPGGLHYSIGNGYFVLKREDEAVVAYETALEYLTVDSDLLTRAMCCKNLGASYEKLGNQQKASQFLHEALSHNPQLPEAHHELGRIYLQKGNYKEALEHFDQVVFAENTIGKQSSVAGWRINALFNLGEGKAAFRDINTLLSNAGSGEIWIWPWCAKQVASFGRTSPENARLSIPFWERYLKTHPNCPSGIREWLLNNLYLQREKQYIGLNYSAFKANFMTKIQYVQKEEAAFLWDRLGHWAQDDEEWEEAEHCFRMAYNLANGEYGYCLGVALGALERYEESLALFLHQAEEIQPDYMSWFQVAHAHEKLGNIEQSIKAYQKAILLNPDHDVAWFNIGGVYWNSGEHEEAKKIWNIAAKKFPDNELVDCLRRDLPFILQ